jgi:DNA-binding NarL/FixJ family response regulator
MRRHVDAARLGIVLRCLIVDDNASFLRAVRLLLERDGITVVGVASTSAEALQRERELQPDVVLVDVRLGDESGTDLVRRLTQAGSKATVILISTHDESDFPGLIEQTSAAGFSPKHELSGALIRRLVRATEET